MRGLGRGLWRGFWLVMVAVVVAGGSSGVWAQVATTTVTDTVYRADGTPAAGTVLIGWSAFTTAGGSAVAAGSTAVTLGTGGGLTVALVPNAGSTPMGTYYTAVFHLDDGTVSKEYWVVPVAVAGAGPVQVGAIRNNVLPSSVAMQTVSKQYVDAAIVAAVTGYAADAAPYVLKAGDSMTGPLVLVADPVTANQAADKNYVDARVAAVPGGRCSGDLTGTYPGCVVKQAQSGAVNFLAQSGGTFGEVELNSGSADKSFVGAYTDELDEAINRDPATAVYVDATKAAPLLKLGSAPGNGFVVIYTSTGNGDWSSNVVAAYFDGTGKVSIGHQTMGLPGLFNVGAADQFYVTAAGLVHETLSTPTSSAAGCSAGDFTDDASFHYVCVAANTWKRAALSSF